jgi:hypothetical protein
MLPSGGIYPAVPTPWTPTMTGLDRRKKMISLRLSEEEYEHLKTRYHNYGAHNVSELARLAIDRIMGESADQKGDFARKLANLEDRVHELEACVSLLRERAKVMP